MRFNFLKTALLAVSISILLLKTDLFPQQEEQVQQPQEQPQKDTQSDGKVYALVGIAIAVVLSGIGSAIGITIAANMGMGAMQDNPDMFPQVLILSALPGTQGIYGFVVGFLILLWSGIMGGSSTTLTATRGFWFMIAGVPVGIAGLISAIYQGKVCASGVAITVKDRANVAKGMTLGAYVEFYAILGLLASILILLNIK
ncbi:MAG: V-type ATP synthase subunit K [bacterium]